MCQSRSDLEMAEDKMPITLSQQTGHEKPSNAEPSFDVVIKNEMPVTSSQQCEHKAPSGTTPISQVVVKDEYQEKKEVLRELKGRWGSAS